MVRASPVLLCLLSFFVAGAAGSALPVAAHAQVRAPTLVEEDLPAEEPPPPKPAEPSLPVTVSAPAPAEAAASAEALKRAVAENVRPIDPVHGTYGELLEAWQARRRSLREHEVGRARAAEGRVLELKAELGILNLHEFAAAEARASARALDANVPADAVARAELAVALAPDFAGAYLALARARFASEPTGQAVNALREVANAVAAAARDPRTSRAFLGDLFSAALLAAFVASALALALLALRHLRLALHDFQHLPIVRLTTPLQAAFVALVALALPLVFRLGPAALLSILAVAAALYLTLTERIVATLALVTVALLPWGAREAVRLTAWTGTLADDVYALEQGADDGRVAAKLAARAERGELPAPALLALGRHHKRRGALDEALRWYEAAGRSRPDALVDIGNVRFLKGDVEGAKAAYLSAIDAAGADVTTLAAAHYDLSKVFVRTSALDQAQDARKRASLEDAALVERHGSDQDFRANRWLVDVPVAFSEMRELASDDAPRAVEDAVLARLAGPVPRWAWPWAPLAVALALWPAILAARRIGPSRACSRCGRPSCVRCDAVGDSLCGQCVNVFVRKDVVDAQDRLTKQAQVRRHARIRRMVTRALAVLGGGGGYFWRGEPVRGALVLFALAFFASVVLLRHGLVPPPYPLAWVAAGKLAIAVPLGLVVWWVAVRDAFRRTRS